MRTAIKKGAVHCTGSNWCKRDCFHSAAHSPEYCGQDATARGGFECINKGEKKMVHCKIL